MPYKITAIEPLIKTIYFIHLSKKTMTRSQLEYILAVDKIKSFSKAAEQCFVTQSTLSALVAKFEQQIGIQLFDRKTHPIRTTTQGEVIIQHLKNIHRSFLLLDDHVNEVKGFEEGNVSIACIPTVAPYLYPLILNSLSEQYPKVNFHISEITTELIVEGVLSAAIDIGIVSTPLNNKSLVEHPLYNEDFLLYDCGNKVNQTDYQVSDIDLTRLWLLEEGHCLRNQVGKICELRQQKKINGNLIYSCGTIFSLIEMVKINKGVTLLPRLAIANNPQVIKDHLHELSAPIPTREIGIITAKSFIKKRILKKLIDQIKGAVQPYLPQADSRERIKPF